MAAGRKPEDLEAMRAVFIACFKAAELRKFFEALDPQLGSDLPGEVASLQTLVHEGVELLDRHGLIDERLFARWIAARPRRRRDISVIAERTGVSLSGDAGQVTGPSPHDGDLITIGPQIALFGRILQEQENRWLVSIDEYVRGDAAALARYISRFYDLHENFQVVTSNVVGSGREITKVPVRIDGRLAIDVEQPRRRSFTTLALGEDSDFVRPMRKLAGADATGYQLGLSLRLPLGEYAYSPYSGSIVQQLLVEAHPPALLARLVRAEMMRLCVQGVRAVVWIGDVTIVREDAESVAFECEIDDKRDGVRSHRLTLKVAPPPSVDIHRLGAPPDVTAMGFTEWMPRADRVLAALAECALFAPEAVRLADVKAKIGMAAEEWNIRRALEHLIARKSLAGHFEVRDGEDWLRLATTWNF